ncbi:alpha-L-fucosidase [Flectobacillus major]|uniref:alpha-L-fucosidase n=1 Tax=Flectobacillus major TaxID=103 RepID=UPI001C54F1DC|nr:alpha-L-fucosidase [Flectobacillus major]
MEYYAFVHFSVNTYTDMSWGKGDEDPQIFNPDKLDCRQWARICKEAGMKGVIITAKHHSGFCLWPSKYTDYSVKNVPWKNGKGDIVREMADACKEYGLKLGIYLSPWDRNHPDYGKPEYITYFRNQLRELLTNYGEIFEVWFDGANGGSGYYGGANETRKIDRNIYYDWENTYKLVRSLQPKIVIWNDGGDRADLRWVGTEAGYVGETNWSLLNAKGDIPEEMLRYGLENGNTWVPGEVNTSIRPEWFYHPKEDSKVKTLPQLMDIYYNSIGRNATLLLNFPIMPNGLIHPYDEKAVLDFRKAVKEAFSLNLIKGANVVASNVRGNNPQFGANKAIDVSTESYWTTDDKVKSASLTFNFAKPTTFNRFLIQEYIKLGQRVKSFTLEAFVNNQWEEVAKETTIGYKRILRFKTVKATKLRLNITDSKECPLISNIGIYDAPQILVPPVAIRERSGDVRIIPADFESQIYYTLDGSTPTLKSNQYTGPIKTDDGKVAVKCISYDPKSKKTSALTEEKFDIAKKSWKIVGIEDNAANNLLDGNPDTQWYQKNTVKMPVDLVIDLGKNQNISGFRYLPDQNWWGSGIITHYSFFVSENGNDWKQVDEGEFSNIKNNPLWQIKTFAPQKARYIKLRALRNTKDDDTVGYAEIDIITE